MANASTIRVFCSYAHEDEQYREELARHLTLLAESGVLGSFEFWHDREIRAGQEWQPAIQRKLQDADVVLFLVSVDLLTSKFVREVEVPFALERHRSGSALLIAVLLRHVLWQTSPLKMLQALPEGLRPVESWPSRDMAYAHICEGILKAVVVWRPHAAVPPPLPARANELAHVMDVGLPHRVTVHKRALLVVLVRQQDETTLADLLETDTTFEISPEEVRSTRNFGIEFPRAPDGKFQACALTLRVESLDFRCEVSTKKIEVKPEGGNEPCVFLLEPLHTGELMLIVELLRDGTRVAGCVLRATGVAAKGSAPAVRSLPLSPIVAGPWTAPDRALTTPPASPPRPKRARPRLTPKALALLAAGVFVAFAATSVFWALRPPPVQPAKEPKRETVKPREMPPAPKPPPPEVQVATPAKPPDCSFFRGGYIAATTSFKMADLLNGFGVSCFFAHRDGSQEVTARWMQNGKFIPKSTEVKEFVARPDSEGGRAIQFTYGGPLDPGQYSVRVEARDKRTGVIRRWSSPFTFLPN